jgi:hypothetical protein
MLTEGHSTKPGWDRLESEKRFGDLVSLGYFPILTEVWEGGISVRFSCTQLSSSPKRCWRRAELRDHLGCLPHGTGGISRGG